LLPTAGDIMKKLALAGSRGSSQAGSRAGGSGSGKAGIARSLQETVRHIRRGGDSSRGQDHRTSGQQRLTEVQVCRFPSKLCTDYGRAINQQESGWEITLTGFPKEIHQLWAKYFRERGYKLRVEIVDFPGGMPGDVGMTLKWG